MCQSDSQKEKKKKNSSKDKQIRIQQKELGVHFPIPPMYKKTKRGVNYCNFDTAQHNQAEAGNSYDI